MRARKSLGNGSDTDRMDRQQQFLGALVNKVQSNGVLLNPTKLYPVLDAATSSLTTDPGLASLRGLYDLVRGMRDIPTEHVQFLTVPRRRTPTTPTATSSCSPRPTSSSTQLRTDDPVVVAEKTPTETFGRSSSDGSGEDGSDTDTWRTSTTDTTTEARRPSGSSGSSPSPAPTFRGNTAAEDTCG